MIVLLGVALVVVGFALRFNPLLVVTVAGIVSALLGGVSPLHILDAFGTGFASSRSVTIAFVVLPVIGLLERYGLQQRAKTLISQAAALTAGRLLLLYLFLRQLTAALGLTSIGGTPQMVRPVITFVPSTSMPRMRTLRNVRFSSGRTDGVGRWRLQWLCKNRHVETCAHARSHFA